jgi:hypothetical protein
MVYLMVDRFVHYIKGIAKNNKKQVYLWIKLIQKSN